MDMITNGSNTLTTFNDDTPSANFNAIYNGKDQIGPVSTYTTPLDGTTHFIVMKVVFGPGANDDTVSLYMDPPTLGVEPATADLTFNNIDMDFSNIRMAGRPLPTWEQDGFLQARFFANGNRRLVFEFESTATDEVTGFVIDGSHRLPEAVEAISESRGSLAVPQHQGDQRLAFQRIRF